MNHKKRRLFCIAGVSIFLLIIVLVIMNAGNSDLAPGTREGIEKGKQSIQELKDEVYTRDDGEPIEQEMDGVADFLNSNLTMIVFGMMFITVFLIPLFARVVFRSW